MKTYEELVKEYKKRQHDTVVDTIATGLTYADEIAVDTGLLEETGLLTELTESVTGLLPFMIISVSEGSKVLLGRKPGMTGLKDGAYRMVKTGAALGVGIIIAFVYAFKSHYTKSFILTLVVLPAIVAVVIMMVNGNIGAGVAVAGAFSLVRFRSVPGTAKEICTLFLAMASGLITGTGYLGIAAIFTAVMCLAFLILGKIDFGSKRNADKYKSFRIVVPEALDYTGVFEDVFREYTSSCELVQVKTVNMGSMFRLTYDVVLKDPAREKELIDRIRCRNGNLEINVSRQATAATEL